MRSRRQKKEGGIALKLAASRFSQGGFLAKTAKNIGVLEQTSSYPIIGSISFHRLSVSIGCEFKMPLARINETVFTKCWVWDMDKYDHLVIMHGVSRGARQKRESLNEVERNPHTLIVKNNARQLQQRQTYATLFVDISVHVLRQKVLPNAGLRKAAYNLLGVHANGISKGPCSMAHWWAPTPGLADIN
ncbi:hypothetical protein VNO77_18539 [Canavalia gladiata]|uniref:Uncharacterized protein n=1 Tax=Canavalia gladiata TaxID=3824 RepID=A0AAN9LL07_CANGL